MTVAPRAGAWIETTSPSDQPKPQEKLRLQRGHPQI